MQLVTGADRVVRHIHIRCIASIWRANMLEFCPRALSVPRREQFSESVTVSFEEHNVQGQICEHIFTPNGGYCIQYPSNILCNTRSLANMGIYKQ